MGASGKIIAMIIASLVVASSGYADMMSVSRPDPYTDPTPAVLCKMGRPWANPLAYADSVDLGSLGLDLLPEAGRDAGQAACTVPLHILADRQSSLSLCLYALFGLGLCRSAPLVKKLSFGSIPSWYHDAGPSQIGHSLAISPDCLSRTLVGCLIQPDCTVESAVPHYRPGVILSLWRTSQFTPEAIAPRGPPAI
ncbi:MAG: hypothetical protein ABFE13_00110 [Phycisphaerales bacterium]